MVRSHYRVGEKKLNKKELKEKKDKKDENGDF